MSPIRAALRPQREAPAADRERPLAAGRGLLADPGATSVSVARHRPRRRDVLQLSKSGKRAIGRVGLAPSHAAHLEQVVDELNLSPHIRTAHPPRLPLPDHVHGLVALDRSPRRVECTKPLLGFHASFDRSMILLQDVVQVLDWCRHLNIAGRIACFMISSDYQPPSATVATQPVSPVLGRWVGASCGTARRRRPGFPELSQTMPAAPRLLVLIVTGFGALSVWNASGQSPCSSMILSISLISWLVSDKARTICW